MTTDLYCHQPYFGSKQFVDCKLGEDFIESGLIILRIAESTVAAYL